MRRLPIAVHIVTAAALLNMLVAGLPVPDLVLLLLFMAAPVLMIWLVWTVLHDRSVAMRDLPDGAEWGYQDRVDLPRKE
jgi:hypothetical protein